MLRFKLVTSQSWVSFVDLHWAEATLVRAQKVFNKILDRDGFSFSPDNERRVLICLSIATGTTLGIHRGRGLGCKWTSTLPRSGNPRTARCPVWTWTWGQSRRWSGSTSPNGVGLCSAHKIDWNRNVRTSVTRFDENNYICNFIKLFGQFLRFFWYLAKLWTFFA